MLKTKTRTKEKCMSCGAPIESGFFCAKCVKAGESSAEVKEDGWQGTRFTGERRKQREKQIFREELALWGKRAVMLVIIALVFVGGWKIFGDRIQTEFRDAADVFRPHDRTDPNHKPVQLDVKGNPVGTRHFAGQHDR